MAATLGLDIAGTFGAWDNRMRVHRMQSAKLAHAKKGQAVSRPPVGYIRTPTKEWVKDPDRAVQDAIVRVFDLYPRLGSLGLSVAYFHEHGLEFPRRSHGHVRWGPVDAALLHSVLRNPAYAGDYVYRRRQSRKRTDRPGVRVTFRPPHEQIWKQDHHEPYLPREAWQQILEMLASRRPSMRRLQGKGHALLQGLLRCGVDDCHRGMKTQYWGRDGVARTATYTCIRKNGWGDITHKVTFPALYADHAVVEHVLAALTAIDHETARAVIEQNQLEHATLERAQRRRLLDAEEDVQRMRQAYLNLPADLQHARIDLQVQYEAAAQQHLALKTQLASEAVPSLAVTTEDVSDLIQLTSNVRQLWQAPQRTHQDRKCLLRTVISEIILRRVTREGADLEIVWKGGLHQPLWVPRARGVAAIVRDRTLAGKNARGIVDELNAAGVVTATGRPISLNFIHQTLGQHGLRLKQARLRAWDIIRQGLLDNRPRREILSQLQEHAPRLGPWDPQRLSEAIRHLRRHVQGIERLPSLLPADQEKRRVLRLIEEALAAGKTWKAIAVSLNESGLRPPRGRTFTPVQVRLLYLRAHRLNSFKLPARSDSTEEGA